MNRHTGNDRFQIVRTASAPQQAEFDIALNGVLLPDWLGIDRHDMAWSGNDLDWFTVDAARFPYYRRLAVIEQAVAVFTGQLAPISQLSVPRAVLYRCHCGCDLCGMISVDIEITDRQVYWQHLGHQEDDCQPPHSPSSWVFDRQDYLQAWQDYLADIYRLKAASRQ